LQLRLKTKTENFNLIYFDGNHSKKATLAYFDLLLPTIDNDSVWIFDDIHWSLEMEEAWEIIKNHPKVKVTIDTFQWGFVFFRREQEKEHFIIRA
jgi:predicted O-methyltransferase YrrM